MYKLDLERFDTYKENNCLEVKKSKKWIATIFMGNL